MATIPREIYTLGAVQFDTRPLAKLQGELLAKKAAQEEALDKYFFDLQGKLPKDQVRAIDRNPFQQKVQNWISKGIALKKQRDKFGAQQEILSGFQELMADANESKAASERQQKIAELKLQGKVDEDDFPIIDKMSKSIYDVDFYKQPDIKKPYTIEDFSANIPTWDLSKRKQFIDFALSGTTPAGKENLKTIEDKENLTQTTTYDKVFTPEQKKNISKKALVILSDKSGIKTYKEILKEGASATPTQQFIDLTAAYNSVFPNDLMNSPEKVAAADIILNMSGVRMPGTPVTTPLFKKREQFKSGLEGAGAKPPRDLYKEIDMATSSPQRLKADKGAPVDQFSGDAQKALIELANDVTGRDDYDQSMIYVKKFSDGKNYIVDFQTNKPLVPFTREDINIGAQVDVKGKRGALTGQVPVPGAIPKKSPIYEIKGKRYTEQELLGMGYTRDQIAPFIKK